MNGDDLDRLRRDLVAARGLDERALRFVVGETVDEVEHSVDRLAKLIASGGTHEHEHEHEHERDPVAAALARAPIEKARAQQALSRRFTAVRRRRATSRVDTRAAASTVALVRSCLRLSMLRPITTG